MATVLVIYRDVPDTAAFDRHYKEVHIPLVKAIPGLSRFNLSLGPVQVRGEAAVHMVATLEFPSAAAMQYGMSSEAGQAAAKDAEGFGVTMSMMIFDAHSVVPVEV